MRSHLSGDVPIGIPPGVIGVQEDTYVTNSSGTLDALRGGGGSRWGERTRLQIGRGAWAPSSPESPLVCPVSAILGQTSSHCIKSYRLHADAETEPLSEPSGKWWAEAHRLRGLKSGSKEDPPNGVSVGWFIWRCSACGQ